MNVRAGAPADRAPPAVTPAVMKDLHARMLLLAKGRTLAQFAQAPGMKWMLV